MGEFNKEFAGLYLLNLTYFDWEESPTASQLVKIHGTEL